VPQIHLGDQIILESKSYNSIFLHVSKEYHKREINATTEKSSWRVIPFAPHVPELELFLKVGDVIRLFHKEADGYLTNEVPEEEFIDEDDVDAVERHRELLEKHGSGSMPALKDEGASDVDLDFICHLFPERGSN